MLLAMILMAGTVEAVDEYQRVCLRWAEEAAVGIVTRGNAEVQVEHWLKELYNEALQSIGVANDQIGGALLRYALAMDTKGEIVSKVMDGDKVVGFINLIDLKTYVYDKTGAHTEAPIPDGYQAVVDKYTDMLLEAVAGTSDELMEKFFGGEEFTPDEIYDALKANVMDGSIVPVLLGSGVNAQGMDYLMQCIDMYVPSPDKKEWKGVDGDKEVTGKITADGNVSLMVWKTIVDPFIGKCKESVWKYKGMWEDFSGTVPDTLSSHEFRFSDHCSLRGPGCCGNTRLFQQKCRW